MFKPVFLWTDVLVFLLAGAVVGFALYARSREHLRAPWRHVVRSRIGLATMVILSAYVAIALLDSVHFREPLDNTGEAPARHYSVEVLSILDKLTTTLREHQEKTYSAPFATHLYAKETIELPGGGQARIYPRLKYGGAHLENPDRDKAGNLVILSLTGIGEGVIVWIILATLLVYILARHHAAPSREVLSGIVRGKHEIPWNVMLYTAGLVILLIFVAANLAGAYHIFGTDKVGQDVFYQTLKSIRTAVIIGTLTTLIMLPFAVLLGAMAGYFGRWVDDVIQYLYTTLNSIPGVLLIASAVLMLQVYIDTHAELFDTTAARADMRLLFLCIILGITSWTGLCRLLRGETMKLSKVEYVQAATAFGVAHFKIIGRHLLPNVMHIVLISVVLDFSGLVLAEAVLSYVGVGVDPSMNSWGNMINSARLEIAREPMVWWTLLAAFVFMFILVLAANLFSDVVRDAFDPRLRST